MALTNPVDSLNIWQAFKNANKAYDLYTAQQSVNFWSDNNFPTNDPIWSEGDYWGPNIIELPDESHVFMTLGQYRLGYLGGVDAWEYQSGSGNTYVETINTYFVKYYGRNASYDEMEYWYDVWLQAAAKDDFFLKNGWFSNQVTPQDEASFASTVSGTSAAWTYKDNAEGNPIIFDDPISAKILWRMIMTDIQRYTRIRLAHITIEVTGEGGSSGTLYGAAYTQQGICFDQTGAALLNWDYLLPFPNTYPVSTGWPKYLTPGNGGIMKIERGYKVMAGVLENWYQEILNKWTELQSDNTIEVELSGCHSSCHSSCHGSRGRR